MKLTRYAYYADQNDRATVKVVKTEIEAESIAAAYASRESEPKHIPGYDTLNWIIVLNGSRV